MLSIRRHVRHAGTGFAVLNHIAPLLQHTAPIEVPDSLGVNNGGLITLYSMLGSLLPIVTACETRSTSLKCLRCILSCILG